MDEKKLKAIKDELLKLIDKKSSVQVEKVDRYINLVRSYYLLDAAIEEHGVMITTENGAQRFTKPNPAIAEKNKVNSSLIALGKDLGLDTLVERGSRSTISDLI
ncbi:P27 family phage terminase small subunit [Paenibacillus lemnae]|uniref:P27 family phage terminase small subunit n=1 Tax=Paenibacillus lemnae TaxID=1330551 RepID=A0A848M8C0_PAELE|nr:P27 family phage terminase small subunit [Paenibacillus lemnae]NMO97458.1 P27 family phage terminase small subunit [Paenibacillus lemnae]